MRLDANARRIDPSQSLIRRSLVGCRSYPQGGLCCGGSGKAEGSGILVSEFAARAGNPVIFEGRLRMADDLEKEAVRIERRQRARINAGRLERAYTA